MSQKTPRMTLLAAALLLIAIGVDVAAADVAVGPYVRLWRDYPSEVLELGETVALTVGPMLTFSAGPISCDFWYGVDPGRTGYLCTGALDPDGDIAGAYSARLDEVGWRISNTGPAFLSASASLLTWSAESFCGGEGFSRLTAMFVAAGGGFRVDPFWVSAEYGVRWTKATPEFADVTGDPKSSILIAGGVAVPFGLARHGETRYPAGHFKPVLEEYFPLGCEDWCWEGQAGSVSWIDEQLGFLIEQPDQTIVRPLGICEEQYIIDLTLIPRSSGSAQHSVGVALRYVDDANYAYVEFRTDGYARYSQVIAGETMRTTSWRRAQSLRTGSPNEVRIVAPGNRVAVYLNGRKVLDEKEVTYVAGDLGLVARSYGAPGTWASFDDVVVRSLTSGVVLDPRSESAREVELLDRALLALVSGVGAFVASREGYLPLTYGFIGALLVDLLAPSAHLIRVE